VEASEPSLAPALAAELALQRRVCAQLDLPLQLLDLAAVEKQAEIWRSLLPRVEPFYAVKCNPNPALVATLWQKWQDWGIGGFDCASPSEMDLAMQAGVDAAKHIVYANPCKQGSAVEHAKAAGVKWIVFDNSAELLKLKEIYPEAELLLRVQTDDSLAQCPLSNKFGAAVEDCGALLEQARHLGLQVIGVSFHVGSGCSQVGAFRSALHRARTVFDEAQKVGFNLRLLDIGGGFPGWDEAGEATFRDHAADIAEVLEELFPCRSLRVIAEPGRFFAAQSQALMTTVVSVAGSAQGNRYYLNDGVYGSFNSLIYDHAKVPKPIVLRDGKLFDDAVAGQPGACTVFGPTCDGFDLISNDLPLPQLQVGDRLLFPNMGAYTSAASTRFNGFDPATAFVYRSCCA
jgi:ornithine decarboxylase